MGISTSQKPKEFIAFLTCRRRGLCAGRLSPIYHSSMGHLWAMYGPCTPIYAQCFCTISQGARTVEGP